MSGLKKVERMGIMFNRLQSDDLNIEQWAINEKKGVVLVSDQQGNCFEVTIKPVVKA